jgi:hypothetical protein
MNFPKGTTFNKLIPFFKRNLMHMDGMQELMINKQPAEISLLIP